MAPPISAAIRLAVVALALLLGGLSLPSLIASLVTIAHDADLDRAKRGEAVPESALTAAAMAHSRAALLFEGGRNRSDAAVALLALPPARRGATGLEIEPLLIESLSAVPAAPFNWNRLAWFRLTRGDRAGAYKAWQMSVLTGRYVPGLMDARLSVGLAMLPISDPDMANLLIDQIRLAAAANTTRLARLAHRTGQAPLIRGILWRDTTLLPDFNRAYNGVLWRERHSK